MKQQFLAFLTSTAEVFSLPISGQTLFILFLLLFCLFGILSCAFALQLRKKKAELSCKQQSIEALKNQCNEYDVREARLTTLLSNERQHAAEKLRLLEDAKQELSLQFENLAGRILDKKSASFTEAGKKTLETVLQPFNLELDILRKQIETIYHNDTRERLSLKYEITSLRELNRQINQEAINLTKALKSDTRAQGSWGELVLDRVLQASGLRDGQEYHRQEVFRTDGNRLQRPDVVVHLPEDRHIIIDSKVSLLHWERCVNAASETERKSHLKEQIRAIYRHLEDLSAKDYSALPQIHCLDFVLMFMPIEAAFSAVFQIDEGLMETALKKNIIIVTPTTLLASLRTVDNLWKMQHQSQNALEIARRAGLLYDKFRGFVEEIEKIGRQIDNCRNSYDNALMRLTRGRGNLISQVEQLKELGVQVKKDLPQRILNASDLAAKDREQG